KKSTAVTTDDGPADGVLGAVLRGAGDPVLRPGGDEALGSGRRYGLGGERSGDGAGGPAVRHVAQALGVPGGLGAAGGADRRGVRGRRHVLHRRLLRPDLVL